MVIQEFGHIGKPIVLLLGPIHLSHELLSRYHFLMPSSEMDESPESEADRIAELVQAKGDGKIYAVAIPTGRWSFSSQLLATKRIDAERIIVEGDLPLPGRLISRVLTESVVSCE